jgi:hypothetical protein
MHPAMASTGISIAESDNVIDNSGYANLQNAVYNASVMPPSNSDSNIRVRFSRVFSYRPWQGNMAITPLVSLISGDDAMMEKYDGCNAIASLEVSRISGAIFDTFETGLHEGQNIVNLQDIDCTLNEYPFWSGGTWKLAHILVLPDVSRTLVVGYFNDGFNYGMKVSHSWIIFDLAPKLAFFDNLESLA